MIFMAVFDCENVEQAAELAAMLKTTTSVVSRIESGNQNVSVDMVGKIAEALGKTVEVLFK